MSIEVRLSNEDLRHAADIALQRITESEKRGSSPRFAYEGSRDGMNTHTVGCWGELAFCRATGLPWPAHVNTFRDEPDVYPFWEVRWSSSLKSLPVKTDDPAHYVVAFVTGRAPVFEVHGYINAGWAQRNLPAFDRPKPNGEPRNRPAHWVDQYSLTPINDDFHELCSWVKDYASVGWQCIICGRPFDEPDRANAG